MRATELARSVVSALLDAGMEHAVLCPGSRNAPLSFALHDASSAGLLTLHTRIDERTAGFLALGMAKVSGRPAAVVTTSGTAAANLHPAVLEAAHAGVPLVAVTADRPAALRGTGANQTTDQIGLFGDAAVSVDLDGAVMAVLGTALGALDRGPVHLNVQLVEPLVPDGATGQLSSYDTVSGPDDVTSAQLSGPDATTLPLGPRTVLVAGDDAGPRARLLAEAANWPLLAEPSSGSRNGENPIRTYRLLLGSSLGRRIERVVVCGHPTLSRPVTRLLSRDDVEVVSVRTHGRWPTRPFPVAAEHDAVTVDGADDPAWLDEWRTADRSLGARIDALLNDEPGLTPYDVAAEVNAAVPADGLLYVGASNPIRDLDLMALPYGAGQHHKVIANRGLAGIDGTLSSAIGAVLARPRTTRALAYVGDVTFLHDLTALVIGPDEARPDLTVVVANDDGGSIFATLEQGAPELGDSYDKLFGTPHGADIGGLCTALKVPHLRVESRAELAHVLASPNGGLEVVEAVVRRDNRRALDARIRALAPDPAPEA
ncbi:MAG TPA: 2-succinyl-5-enolpyruvyl-6-hydroxy-3-cyclohexene-1-carboxylic-acid synthase [Marmoricola sp.]|nr:2-succinyl-5-enolpyruvyl-6-hydroxy-3-cyclohexene-1-carboxylic-acid synthase [Marmoricola sp.]